MKLNQQLCVLGLAVVTAASMTAWGQSESSHYVNGVEGIKAGSLPPQGLYGRLYTLYYGAGHLRDAGGDRLDPDFKLNVFAAVPRVIWITPLEILGANYGCDFLVPLVYTDVKVTHPQMGAMRDRQTGIGDPFLEPILLSWHKPQFDVSSGFGIYFPAGQYEPTDASSPGKGFYTYMFTLGGTYYIDPERTWAASALGRYEINSYKRIENVRPGNDFHFEYGISKNLAKVWEVGLAGYCQWQVTDDRGSDVAWNGSEHDQVYAVGPEINYFVTPARLNVSLRYEQEFLARDRPEGQVATLTLTKIF